MELGEAGTIAIKEVVGYEIDDEVNTWLQENADVEVIDIRFIASVRAGQSGTDALIIYRNE